MNPLRLLGHLLVLVPATLWAVGTPHGPAALPRSTPERQGVSSGALLEWIDALDRIDALHSVLLVRHGHVVTEGWWAPYAAGSNHELYSLSKSFTSTAVGLAVAEGRLGVDDEVLKFFPEDAPAAPGANLKAMRVRDLLTMTTGHQDEPPTAPDKVSARSFLAQPVPHKPGTHFKYNTAATFMLSAIVQKQTGQTVLDYLRPRLFNPLGITQPTWQTNSQGISLGGYGLRVRTEDIARFGLLYLHRGQWDGRTLLPAAWVDAATARQVSNGSNPRSDWDQGYGFQFWRCRHGAYRGDGAFGQYCVVLPEQDAVLVITSGVKDMQAILDVAWDKLLPAFQPKALPADPAGQRRLDARLASLTVPYATGSPSSTTARRVLGRRLKFAPNDQKLEAITVHPRAEGPGWILTTRLDGVETRIPCGQRAWIPSRGPLGSLRDEPLAASAGWVDDDTLEVKVCATETPYYTTLRLRFDGDQVTRSSESNVGFGATRSAPVAGRVE